MLDTPRSWLYAVEVQFERAQHAAEADVEYAFEWEVYAFANALRNLIRAVKLDNDQPRVRQALSEFDRSTPNAAMVRDILEHWDEYTDLRGRRQKNGDLPLAFFVVIWNRRDLSVGFAREGAWQADDEMLEFDITSLVVLDLRDAVTSARRLVHQAGCV